MAAPVEVLITTELSGQLWNACVWNPVTCAALTTYKGSSASARTLCLIGSDYLLSADVAKPLINVWSINRRDHTHMRMVCSGKVTALAVSPDGCYCVAGIADKLHVWQISTGNQLAVLTGHYLKITCVRFTDDGSHFISGSDDGSAFVWSLNRVVARGSLESSHNNVEPRHVWSQHASAITDIHVGVGGAAARVATASLDSSVKIWQLSTGQQIETFIFDSPITSVITDNSESRLFAGATNGNIYLIDMTTFNGRTSCSGSTPFILKGHKSAVTCLSISLGCETLVSGSTDGTAMLWNTFSRECIDTVKHKGHVTNCLLIPTPVNLLEPDTVPSIAFTPFKRNLSVDGRSDSRHDVAETERGSEVRETIDVHIDGTRDRAELGKRFRFTDDIAELTVECKRSESVEDVQIRLEENLNRATRVNHELYMFTVDKILGSSV